MKGLEVGQNVYVMTPAGAAINASVHDVSGDVLDLELYSGMRDPMERLAGQAVSVQFASRRGICRVDGQANRSKRGITAMHFEATSKVQIVQRRDYVRVDVALPVTYEPMGASGWTAETNTLNISAGGFLLSEPEGLRLGEQMHFTIDLGGEEEPLVVWGEAVRETSGGALGIQFLQLSDKDRERLVRWVFARERLARQITRDG